MLSQACFVLYEGGRVQEAGELADVNVAKDNQDNIVRINKLSPGSTRCQRRISSFRGTRQALR